MEIYFTMHNSLWQKFMQWLGSFAEERCPECNLLFSVPGRRAASIQLGEYSCRSDSLPVLECPSRHSVCILPDPEFAADFLLDNCREETRLPAADAIKRATCNRCRTILSEEMQPLSVTVQGFPTESYSFPITITGPSRRCPKCGLQHFADEIKVHDVVLLLFREARVAKFLSFKPSK